MVALSGVIVALAGVIVTVAGVIVAAKSAADAAKAAQDSIELTREMSQLAQRAWVGVVEIKGEPTVGQPFRVFVTIRNSGATFAKGVRVATYFVSKDDGTLPNYAKADQMEGIQGTPGVILLPPIVYSDIFGVEHWTTYSARYHQGAYVVTEQFNDADDTRAPPGQRGPVSVKRG